MFRAPQEWQIGRHRPFGAVMPCQHAVHRCQSLRDVTCREPRRRLYEYIGIGPTQQRLQPSLLIRGQKVGCPEDREYHLAISRSGYRLVQRRLFIEPALGLKLVIALALLEMRGLETIREEAPEAGQRALKPEIGVTALADERFQLSSYRIGILAIDTRLLLARRYQQASERLADGDQPEGVLPDCVGANGPGGPDRGCDGRAIIMCCHIYLVSTNSDSD